MAGARRLIVRGRVQGVFFRDWTVARARAGGIAGWIRNRPDGTVEIHAEGETGALNAFARDCHSGPAAAEVEAVEIAETAAEGLTRFERRATG